MICPKCGQNIEDNGFCPFCGFGISNDNSKNLTELDNVVNEDENEINEQSTSLDEDYLIIDNNPFSYSGRITRLPYFWTLLVISIFLNINNCIENLYDKNHNDYILLLYAFKLSMLIFVIIGFFAMIKRLRDIKWNPWLCLISFVPIVNYIFGLILIFKKSKYKDTADSKLST